MSDCVIIKWNYELCFKVADKFNIQSETLSRVTLIHMIIYVYILYIPSLMKIGSGIQNFIARGGFTVQQIHREQDDLISPLLFFSK
jgi:hypothetical protein